MLTSLAMRTALACALAVVSGVPALAQAKVAVINGQKALLDTAEMKKAQADLEARFRPRAQALEKVQRELQDIQTQLENSQGKLSPDGEAELRGRGQRRQREAQRLSEDLQGDVERERNEIIGRAAQRMNDIVKRLSETKGLDLVVDVTTTIYFKPALDITAEATAEYDKAHPLK
ncbi:MAG: OmpH family outer membrane protein [Bryobacteraceae bacterium]|nr:OmpH family outer membrane protein [Bryobacteraceae bacterium]